MPDPKPRRTGTVFRYVPAKPGEKHGHYVVRCSAPDGSRPLFHLDPGPESPEAREAALQTATEISEGLWAQGLGAAPKAERRAISETEGIDAREWWDRFFEVREARKMYPMQGNYTKHIQPAFDIPWQVATTADVERFRDSLDSRVSAGELAPKTAFNIWTLFRTAAKAASGNWRKGDKQRSLKVCDKDPTEGVAGTDYDPRDEGKELQWLYPREVLAVAECAEVPIETKRRIVLATYLCVRGSELAALTWEKVDLERRVVIVDQAYNQERKATKKTKTGNRGRRRYSIEPALMPLLRTLHEESGGQGKVIDMPIRHEWAVELRRALKTAKVKRPELFTTTATNHRIRFHDLRASGLTWMAIRGDTSVQISHVAGHTDFNMTAKYLAAAGAVDLLPGEQVFPELPADLMTPPSPSSRPSGSLSQVLSQVTQVPEIRWVDRDSNPDGNATKDRQKGQFVTGGSATTVTDRTAQERTVTTAVTACDSSTGPDLTRPLALARALEALVSDPLARPIVLELVGLLEAARGEVATVTSLAAERAKRERET